VGALGLLRGSIMTEIRGTSAALQGVVLTASPYAHFVEEDTRPHWAPIAPLKLWARRVLGDESAAYAVQHAIAVRGTRGKHMFRQGEAYIRPRLPDIFARAVERARVILGG
jgi:hypothetical protein